MVLPRGLLARYQQDFAVYANTVGRFEQQTLAAFMAGGYFTRHLARMRLVYKRRMESFAFVARPSSKSSSGLTSDGFPAKAEGLL